MDIKVKRLLATFVDFYIILLVDTTLFGVLSELLTFVTHGTFAYTSVCIVLAFVFYVVAILFRDCIFKNASVGKRIFKLQIVKTDETDLTVMDLIKRNAPAVILHPVELFLLIFDESRLGDRWAGTMVIGYE